MCWSVFHLRRIAGRATTPARQLDVRVIVRVVARRNTDARSPDAARGRPKAGRVRNPGFVPHAPPAPDYAAARLRRAALHPGLYGALVVKRRD